MKKTKIKASKKLKQKTTSKKSTTKKPVALIEKQISTKKSSKVKNPKNEFRKNKDTGHPSYIYQKVGRKYVYIGLTHSPITNDVKNIKLDKNPNPEDEKKAYFRPKASEANSNRFKKKEQGWALTSADKKKAAKIVAGKKIKK